MPSERQLVCDAQMKVACHWFLAADIGQQIFDEIVRQAIQHGPVGADALYTDDTHIKANINKSTPPPKHQRII